MHERMDACAHDALISNLALHVSAPPMGQREGLMYRSSSVAESECGQQGSPSRVSVTWVVGGYMHMGMDARTHVVSRRILTCQ